MPKVILNDGPFEYSIEIPEGWELLDTKAMMYREYLCIFVNPNHAPKIFDIETNEWSDIEFDFPTEGMLGYVDGGGLV